MRTSRGERLVTYLILVGFAAFAIWPLVTVLWNSIQPPFGQSGLRLGNYAEAWRLGGFGEYMITSVEVAALVVSVATVASILTGYAFGTMRFRGSSVLFHLFIFGLMIPAEAIVIPLFFDLRTLGLTDTIWAIALPQIAQSIAFGTFWMRAQFRAMPVELIEAGALDGASARAVLWRILVPIARPAVVTLVVLLFMWTWNEFLIPLVMAPAGELRTAPLSLAMFKGQYTSATALMAAAAVLVALPVVVLFVTLQRYFIQGMAEGAVRG